MDVRVLGKAMKVLDQLEDAGIFDGRLKVLGIKGEYSDQFKTAVFTIDVEDEASLEACKALEATMRALLMKEAAKKK